NDGKAAAGARPMRGKKRRQRRKPPSGWKNFRLMQLDPALDPYREEGAEGQDWVASARNQKVILALQMEGHREGWGVEFLKQEADRDAAFRLETALKSGRGQKGKVAKRFNKIQDTRVGRGKRSGGELGGRAAEDIAVVKALR